MQRTLDAQREQYFIPFQVHPTIPIELAWIRSKPQKPKQADKQDASFSVIWIMYKDRPRPTPAKLDLEHAVQIIAAKRERRRDFTITLFAVIMYSLLNNINRNENCLMGRYQFSTSLSVILLKIPREIGRRQTCFIILKISITPLLNFDIFVTVIFYYVMLKCLENMTFHPNLRSFAKLAS